MHPLPKVVDIVDDFAGCSLWEKPVCRTDPEGIFFLHQVDYPWNSSVSDLKPRKQTKEDMAATNLPSCQEPGLWVRPHDQTTAVDIREDGYGFPIGGERLWDQNRSLDWIAIDLFIWHIETVKLGNEEFLDLGDSLVPVGHVCEMLEGVRLEVLAWIVWVWVWDSSSCAEGTGLG